MAEKDEVSSDPHDDIDYISEEGIDHTGFAPSMPFSSGWMGSPNPVFIPSQSTPLESDDEEGSIPRYAMWSMKYLRHGYLFSRSELEIRARFGSGRNEAFVIDDGRKLCLICRE